MSDALPSPSIHQSDIAIPCLVATRLHVPPPSCPSNTLDLSDLDTLSVGRPFLHVYLYVYGTVILYVQERNRTVNSRTDGFQFELFHAVVGFVHRLAVARVQSMARSAGSSLHA